MGQRGSDLAGSLGLAAVGEACHTLGDIERTDQVITLMQKEHGDKRDAFDLLFTIALRQQKQGDEPGLQRTLARLQDACDYPESAAESITRFWDRACARLMEAGEFDDVV